MKASAFCVTEILCERARNRLVQNMLEASIFLSRQVALLARTCRARIGRTGNGYCQADTSCWGQTVTPCTVCSWRSTAPQPQAAKNASMKRAPSTDRLTASASVCSYCSAGSFHCRTSNRSMLGCAFVQRMNSMPAGSRRNLHCCQTDKKHRPTGSCVQTTQRCCFKSSTLQTRRAKEGASWPDLSRCPVSVVKNTHAARPVYCHDLIS